MKKKLKQFRSDVLAAKTAWLNARKGGKTEQEIKSAFDEYVRLNSLLDGFEADGKTDEDEIEVKSAVTDDAKDITLVEVEKMVIASVKSALKDSLPAGETDPLTEERVKSIVVEALKAHFPDGKPLATAKATNEGVQAAINDAMAKFQTERQSKMNHDQSQAGSRGSGNIEIPCSWTKGNLPLHGKQLLNCLLQRPQDEGIAAADIQRGKAHDDSLFDSIKRQGGKALTTTGTGTGLELIPRTLSAELQRRLYLESMLAQAFLSSEIDMPSDPYDLPLVTTDPTFYLNSTENTDATASEPGTATTTLTTKRLMALVQYSYEVDEDSIVPILPKLQELLSRAAARALETALINGDTTSTHQDSDITAVNDVNKAWKGFRKLALAITQLKTDISSGGISRANLTAILKLLGKWGSRTSDLMWIVGPKTWTALLGIDEFAQAYNRGGASTFASGAPLSSPYGGQIVLSDQQRENLNASGVYDGVTTTKGCVLLVYKPGFLFGSRRAFKVETARNIRSQTNDIVASFRKAFSPVETPANLTAQTVGAGFNYTT